MGKKFTWNWGFPSDTKLIQDHLPYNNMPQNSSVSLAYQLSPSSSNVTKWNREKFWCILQLLFVLIIIPLPPFPQRPFRKVQLRSPESAHFYSSPLYPQPPKGIYFTSLAESEPRQTSLCEYYPYLLLSALLRIFFCVYVQQQPPIILIVTDVTWLEKQLVSMVRILAQSNLDSVTAVSWWLFCSTVWPT